MADQKNPETSTVRSALAAVGAVDDLLRPGRDGCVLDADTAVAALTTLIEEVRALRPHQARDVLDHLEARLAAGALSTRSQAITVASGHWGTLHVDPSYDPLPRFGDSPHPGDPLGGVEPTTAEGTDDLTDDVDDLPNTPLDGPQPDTLDLEDPWSTEDGGKPERVTAAVDELAARVNAEPGA